MVQAVYHIIKKPFNIFDEANNTILPINQSADETKNPSFTLRLSNSNCRLTAHYDILQPLDDLSDIPELVNREEDLREENSISTADSCSLFSADSSHQEIDDNPTSPAFEQPPYNNRDDPASPAPMPPPITITMAYRHQLSKTHS